MGELTRAFDASHRISCPFIRRYNGSPRDITQTPLGMEFQINTIDQTVRRKRLKGVSVAEACRGVGRKSRFHPVKHRPHQGLDFANLIVADHNVSAIIFPSIPVHEVVTGFDSVDQVGFGRIAFKYLHAEHRFEIWRHRLEIVEGSALEKRFDMVLHVISVFCDIDQLWLMGPQLSFSANKPKQTGFVIDYG